MRAWMEAQGRQPAPMGRNALRCSLTPEGTLFVLHAYPPRDYDAAGVAPRVFEHFTLPTACPPEPLRAPLVALDFLLATKLFALQERGRGGERRKDAYDLAVGLRLAPPADVLRRLDGYAAHRGHGGKGRAIARAAGAWLVHFGGSGYQSLANWLHNYAPDIPAEDVRTGLAAAVGMLAEALGEPVEPTEEERCRFLLQELSPRDLAPLAVTLGFKGDAVAQSKKMRDFVLDTALPRLSRPLPSDATQLLRALREAAR